MEEKPSPPQELYDSSIKGAISFSFFLFMMGGKKSHEEGAQMSVFLW